jgi:hypothetical protein
VLGLALTAASVPLVRNARVIDGFEPFGTPADGVFLGPLPVFAAFESLVVTLVVTCIESVASRWSRSARRDVLAVLAAVAIGYVAVVAACLQLAYSASVLDGDTTAETLSILSTMKEVFLNGCCSPPERTFLVLFAVYAMLAGPLAFSRLSGRHLGIQVALGVFGWLVAAAPALIWLARVHGIVNGHAYAICAPITAHAYVHLWWYIAMLSGSLPLALAGLDCLERILITRFLSAS